MSGGTCAAHLEFRAASGPAVASMFAQGPRMSLNGPPVPKRRFASLRPLLVKATVLVIVVGAFVGGWLSWEVAGFAAAGAVLALLLVGIGHHRRDPVVMRAGLCVLTVMAPLLFWPLRSGGFREVQVPVKVVVVDARDRKPVAGAEACIAFPLFLDARKAPGWKVKLDIPSGVTGPDGTIVLPVPCICAETTERFIWGQTATHRILQFATQSVAVEAKGYDEVRVSLPTEERERDDIAWFQTVAPLEGVEPVEITVELRRGAR